MIVLFTDFGWDGPYVGQMKAVLSALAPAVPAIDLMHDAPAFDPRASAYLLAALAPEFPPGTVFLAVVDPGVGGARDPLACEIDGRWFVGPGNGLFEIVARRADAPVRRRRIAWRPARLSASFHGRDLFAPTAARIASGEAPDGPGFLAPAPAADPAFADWPDDLAEIVYVDGFGNAMTGLRADRLSGNCQIVTGSGLKLVRAETFSDLPPGRPFWYANANGLVEIAVNQGRAADVLGLGLGAKVTLAGS